MLMILAGISRPEDIESVKRCKNRHPHRISKMFMSSVLSILILLLSPLIVLSNTLIISVWLRFKRLRTPSNALVISLAVADLGFGLFLPAAVALELTLPQNAGSGRNSFVTPSTSNVLSYHTFSFLTFQEMSVGWRCVWSRLRSSWHSAPHPCSQSRSLRWTDLPPCHNRWGTITLWPCQMSTDLLVHHGSTL